MQSSSRHEFHAVPTSLSELERWASLAAATAIVTYGLSRRSVPGFCLVLAGVPLAYRGLSGEWPYARRSMSDDTREALGGDWGIHVRESIRIERPLVDVYRFWRRFENFPTFMKHLEAVTQLDGQRSHWVAIGPAGLKVEWDAEIINEVENKVIGWRSLPGADVVTAGSVTCTAVRGGRSTQVSVNLQYSPPAGRTGAFLASLIGQEPSQTIREDLRRVKQLLEAGELARATAGHPMWSDKRFAGGRR